MAPKVWNKRDPNVPKDGVYIGRPTMWGNPFTHLNYGQGEIKVVDRIAAVDCYNLMLGDVLNHFGVTDDLTTAQRQLLQAKQDWIKAHLEELKGKDLICWCAPDGGLEIGDPRHICHGQPLIRLANP